MPNPRKTLDFPNYPKVNQRNFSSWNEDMFVKYNNERVYKHPNPIIRFIEKRRVELLIQALNPRKTDVILGAGCGEGYIENLITTYKKYYLVDLSKTAIAKAKQKLINKKNIELRTANLESLPYPQNKFDKIECSEVIEHVLNPETMMSEFHRVIKKNGLLVISFPNEPLINLLKQFLLKIGLFRLIFPNVPVNMLEEWHLRSMDYNRFREIIKKDWKIVTVSAAPFSLFPIRYIVSCKPIAQALESENRKGNRPKRSEDGR